MASRCIPVNLNVTRQKNYHYKTTIYTQQTKDDEDDAVEEFENDLEERSIVIK